MSLFWRLCTVGLVFALAGAAAALPFVLASDDPATTASEVVVQAALAAAFASVVLWAGLVSEGAPPWRAPLAGGLTGIAAHPIMWVLISLGVGRDMGAAPDQQLRQAVLTSTFFSVFSALAYGPLTVTVGALVGALLGRFPLLRPPATPSDAAPPRGDAP